MSHGRASRSAHRIGPQGNSSQILNQGQYGNALSNYAAYVPDLPGCIATGATVEETERRLRQAIVIHVRGPREDGLRVPAPSSLDDYLEIPA
jgi:predicted RNase H-like HicB family nuclease